MPFDWRDFLSLAKELSNYAETSSLQEAAVRTAVSRAYYAAFCWAMDYASKSLGFQRSGTAEDHATLRQLLQQSNQTKIASKLNNLRRWRNLCDYDANTPNLGSLVQNALAYAEKVIAACNG